MNIEPLPELSTHQNLMGIHWTRQEESSIMWSVELVTKDVNGGNSFDIVLCAEVGCQKTAKLHQCVVTLQEDNEVNESL